MPKPGFLQQQWAELLPHLESGAISPVLGQTYPLREAAKGLADLDERRARSAENRSAAARECRMADGMRIEVFANLGSLADAKTAVANGAEGCGLLRTEFLFLDRDTVVPTLYPRLADFASLAARFDPAARFRNPYLARLLP